MNTLTVLEKYLGKGSIRENEVLAPYTTLKIGGPAQFFLVARTANELVSAVKAAIEAKIPYYILGSGSNLLISDRGLTGLMIRNETNAINIVKRSGKVSNNRLETRQALIEVDSGVLVNRLVRFTCDEGLSGLERRLGLPGTVGGALFMNSKWTKPPTYIGDFFFSARILDKNGNLKTVEQKYFDFSYDRSILQKTHETVVKATFILKTEDKKILWQRANQSMEYRRQTQPMGVATAGCTFRNITLADAVRLLTPDRTTSAGYLLDQAGLKNFQIGQAKFSDKHANFIYNLGGATGGDVKGLIDEAQRRIKTKFALKIEPEIELLGDFN